MEIKLKEYYFKHQRIVNSVLLFVVAIVCMLGFADNSLFPTDEEEIFVKGMAITKGQYLYKDIVSQHMPLMYYLAAVFSALGVHSIVGFRIAFYVLMAIIWAVIQFRYGEKFSYKVIWFYALGYMAISAYIAQGTSILSEQIQQFGLIILLFEFIIFIEKKRIELNNSIFISLAIVLSFGSAFVSVFPIAVIFFAVVIYIWKLCKTGNESLRKSLLKDCTRLVVIASIPWICYLLYLVFTNTLLDAFYWNYTFNREIYSEYMKEAGQTAYGKSVIGTYFLGIKNWFSVWLMSNNFFEKLNLSTLLGTFVILYIIQNLKKKKWCEGITIFMYILACSTRGVFTFHGLPCVAVECLIMSFYIKELIGEKSVRQFVLGMKEYQMGVVVVVSLVLFASMISQSGDIINEEQVNQLRDENSIASYVQKLTDEDEAIGFAGGNYDILVEANRVMINKNPATAWIWDGCKDEIMEVLVQQKPRIIVYQNDTALWGYKLSEFAAELDEFIQKEYTNLNLINQDYIYVRNDYYEEALEILNISFPLFEVSKEESGVTDILYNGDEIKIKYFASNCEIDSYALQFGTYQKDEIADFDYEFRCLDNGELLQEGTIEGDSILDNEYTIVEFEKSVPCKEGQVYELKLTVNCESGEEVSLYINEGNKLLDCYINDKHILKDISVLFFGTHVN